MNIAITGANSGVGTILLRHLAARDDIQVVACVRSARAAAALPASPRISARAIDYSDREGLASALTGTGCVVHLAGILFESPASTYQTANVDATQAVVDACRKAGVSRVVLVSVLGADSTVDQSVLELQRARASASSPNPVSRPPSFAHRSCWDLRMAGARAVVHAAARPTVTLLGGGRHSIRPLDVDDLSRAILRCCETPVKGAEGAAGAAVYELVGPEATAYRDVIARTAALMGHEVSVRSMPVWLAKLGAAIAGWKRQGGMTPTVIDVITSDEAVHENADVELGVTLTPLSATLEKLLPSQTEVPHP